MPVAFYLLERGWNNTETNFVGAGGMEWRSVRGWVRTEMKFAGIVWDWCNFSSVTVQ